MTPSTLLKVFLTTDSSAASQVTPLPLPPSLTWGSTYWSARLWRDKGVGGGERGGCVSKGVGVREVDRNGQESHFLF